ncbi:hypothetical protein [Mesorhizobium sp.]|uniref:hypothetical protein n=1 Tax=Mesorhizobium sp. TaxID=1871066 RepID=UPI0025F3DE96|nr:hypothetical protein [Mesorhizobium sp.]
MAHGAFSERRAELDLQISLLNEHETTRLIETALTERLKVSTPADDELPQLGQNVNPQAVMSQIEQVSENQTKRLDYRVPRSTRNI